MASRCVSGAKCPAGSVNFRVWQIAGESPGPVRSEDLVSRTPDRQERDLAGAEVFLELRVAVDVGRVVAEERQLHLIVAGPAQQSLIVQPGVRADEAPVGGAVLVLPRVVSELNLARAPGSVSAPGAVAYANRSSQKGWTSPSM
jgi:hypothetical protein